MNTILFVCCASSDSRPRCLILMNVRINGDAASGPHLSPCTKVHLCTRGNYLLVVCVWWSSSGTCRLSQGSHLPLSKAEKSRYASPKQVTYDTNPCASYVCWPRPICSPILRSCRRHLLLSHFRTVGRSCPLIEMLCAGASPGPGSTGLIDSAVLSLSQPLYSKAFSFDFGSLCIVNNC